jgi:hypothetical protein
MTTYTAQYPLAHNNTYVKATSADSNQEGWRGTDPALSLTGSYQYTSWLTPNGTVSNQKHNIDLGAPRVIRRLCLENFHHNGGLLTLGIKNFIFYGTHSAAAFANTTYSDLTDLVELGSYQASQHAATNASDPQYFLVENGTAYQYYALRCADNWGGSFLGFRHFELQTEDGYGSEPDVLEAGVEHVWSVKAAIEAGVEHVWSVNAAIENGIKHVWEALYTPVAGGVEHVWRYLLVAGVEHRWHMVPVVQGGINHRWSDLPVLQAGIEHSWRTLKVFQAGIEHNWPTYGLVAGGVEHRWGVLGPPLYGGVEHGWQVRDYAVLQGGVQHLWMGGGIGVDQEFEVSVSFGGGELRPYEIRRRRSRSEAGVEIRLEMAGEPLSLAGAELPDDLYRYNASDRAAAIAAARVEIDINGTVRRYLATEIAESVQLDGGYTLVAESDLVLLGGPYADNISVVDGAGNKSYAVEFGPGMAAVIAAELAALGGFTCDYQAVNWWIPGGVLYANNEPPLDVLRKMTAAIGAMIQPGASLTEIVVRPFFPVSVPHWRTAAPDEYVSYGGNCFSVAAAPSVRPGYNLYRISDQISVAQSLRFEERDVRRGLKELLAYEVPWTGVMPALEKSGGDWVVIEAGEVIEEVIEAEEVELIQGLGRTQQPIYQMVDRDYGDNRSLGAISFGEDGSIATEILSQSLCLVTYRTRYWRWLVADPRDERTQLYTWPAWADVPITIVLQFGDAAAASGFVVFEPDETLNVDGDGNVLSQMAPGDPYHFQGQHDDTVRIDSIACSSGAVAYRGQVSRAKEQQVVFADGAALELPYIPAGEVNIDWYGRAPQVIREGRKLTPGSSPAIGEAAYGARMHSYRLTPPPLVLSGEELYHILIVITMVST